MARRNVLLLICMILRIMEIKEKEVKGKVKERKKMMGIKKKIKDL